MNATFTDQYTEAATRAGVIARVARDRFAGPATMAALDTIARHLDAAAAHLQAVPPGAYDTLPAQVCAELDAAETLAAQHPGARLPEGFTHYVLEVLDESRTVPFPAPLNPSNARDALQETDLRNRLWQLHDDQELMLEAPNTWLETVLTVWRDWERLAAAVRVDNGRPCNQPTTPAPAAAPAAAPEELDVTGLTAYTVGIIRLAESKGLRPSWTKPHGKARRLIINGTGPHGTFGLLEIGKTSGKVLRGHVTYGNGGRTKKAQGTNAVRALLADLTLTQCSPGCNAFDDRGCRP
ncbi:hypothetical protein ABZ468_07645 [Streptomyces sp. NPDC005708]|uniref:hypothetical protein n=1 Tax=Streptomyces sp. NPDC005708 TaxID=3154564 RepID=UPI00340E903C